MIKFVSCSSDGEQNPCISTNLKWKINTSEEIPRQVFVIQLFPPQKPVYTKVMEHTGVVWGLVLASQNVLNMENEEECFEATNCGDSLSRSILFLKGNVLGNCLPTREYNGGKLYSL
ncbi:hypothetical protein SADUNF_Sadunf03G0099200 [Salix dunnii]|uniref:Uncharacterized protein n=1 Tax=Salix dunnii TaxID=1413687 RepID=A0A835N4A4_9ROSI|nr:hypothetical protein SADUNF_Sadunf03G0099200 [Salix dunnii]